MSRPGTAGRSVSIAAWSRSAVLSRFSTNRVRSTAWLTYPATAVRAASSVTASTWGSGQHHISTPRLPASGTHSTERSPSESYPATASALYPASRVSWSGTNTVRCSRMARVLGWPASRSSRSMATSTGRTSSGSTTRRSPWPSASSSPTKDGSEGPRKRLRRRRVRSVRPREWPSSTEARSRRSAWSRSCRICSEAIRRRSSTEQAAVRSPRSCSSPSVHFRGLWSMAQREPRTCPSASVSGIPA